MHASSDERAASNVDQGACAQGEGGRTVPPLQGAGPGFDKGGRSRVGRRRQIRNAGLDINGGGNVLRHRHHNGRH